MPDLEEELKRLKTEKYKTIRDLCEIDELLADIKIIMARLLKRQNET